MVDCKATYKPTHFERDLAAGLKNYKEKSTSPLDKQMTKERT